MEELWWRQVKIDTLGCVEIYIGLGEALLQLQFAEPRRCGNDIYAASVCMWE